MIEILKNNFKNNSAVYLGITVIFFAFLLRAIIGFVTFGSVDLWLVNLQGASAATGNTSYYPSPYFPYLYFFTYASEVMYRFISMPMAFSYKLLPIIFDSCLAGLIYSIGLKNRIGSKNAFFLGILYSISPIPVIIFALHTQWDSIVLFLLMASIFIKENYKHSNKSIFYSGLFFALSVGVKPYVIIFAPFTMPFEVCSPRIFISKFKPYFLGVLFIIVVSGFIFWITGLDIVAITKNVINYSNGVRPKIFGLPNSNYLGFLYDYRIMYLVITYGLAVYLYALKKISPYLSIAIIFLAILSIEGLAPQYLIWPLPFLFAGLVSFEGLIYGIGLCPILLLYYINPFASQEAWENMATFATLKGIEWAMPVEAFMDPSVGNFLTPFMDTILPSCMFILLIATIFSGIRIMNKVNTNIKNSMAHKSLSIFLPSKNWIIWIVGAAFIYVSLLCFAHHFRFLIIPEAPSYETLYSLYRNIQFKDNAYHGFYEYGTIFNIPLLIIFLIIPNIFLERKLTININSKLNK